MKKILFFLLIVLFSFNVKAGEKRPIAAECSNFKGKRIDYAKGKYEYTDDKISSQITYIFAYDQSSIIGSDGIVFLLLPDSLSGFYHSYWIDNMITFYPTQKKVSMSKLSYFKRFSNASPIDMATRTLIGDCKFIYSLD